MFEICVWIILPQYCRNNNVCRNNRNNRNNYRNNRNNRNNVCRNNKVCISRFLNLSNPHVGNVSPPFIVNVSMLDDVCRASIAIFSDSLSIPAANFTFTRLMFSLVII